MSHLEKSDAVIHDLIEPTAIGCDAIFPRTAIRTLGEDKMPGGINARKVYSLFK